MSCDTMTSGPDLAYAREQACWGIAALKVVRMTEHDRIMALLRFYADELQTSDLSSEELLTRLYSRDTQDIKPKTAKGKP